MTQPINLNRARKQKARLKKQETATRNSQTYGHTKASRVLDAARTDKANRMLDQHQLDDDA